MNDCNLLIKRQDDELLATRFPSNRQLNRMLSLSCKDIALCMAPRCVVRKEGRVSVVCEFAILHLIILHEYADRKEENGRVSRLTSNSIGLFTCGPQVKMSCSNAHGPLLDVKLKVLSVNRRDGQNPGI